MDILARIKPILNEMGLSFNRFEEECGFSKNSVVKWDKSQPSADKLLRAAKFLGVSTDYLCGNTDDPTSPQMKALPDYYFHFLKGAAKLDLTKKDLDLLMDIAKRFRSEDK